MVRLRYTEMKDPDFYYLPLQFCNGGPLNEFVEVRGSLTEFEAQVIMRQLVRGLVDIHQLKIIHRDLKSENVMLHFPKAKP